MQGWVDQEAAGVKRDLLVQDCFFDIRPRRGGIRIPCDLGYSPRSRNTPSGVTTLDDGSTRMKAI